MVSLVDAVTEYPGMFMLIGTVCFLSESKYNREHPEESPPEWDDS